MGIVVKTCVLALKCTVFNVYFVLSLIPFILLRMYCKRSMGKLETQKRLDGKTVIITGANVGIGYETAKELAYRGARVLLACKNVGSGYLAKNNIIKETRNDDVEVYRLDLSSLRSVRNFAKEILEKENRLDVLIFNAGIGFITHKKTFDKLPLTLQINCLSSFLLTNLLLDFMKKTAPVRIIFTGSVLHHFQTFNVENLENPSNPFSAFCNSKFATLLMTNYLAEKLKDTGITVNTVHPGLVNVPVLRRIKNPLIQELFGWILENYGKPLDLGAATTLTAALDPKIAQVSGSYFSDCKESTCVPSKSKDLKLAEEMWVKFASMVDIKENEKNKLLF